MRTTIDLPDELLRQAKARAALEGRKLKDLVAEYIERGLTASRPSGRLESPRRRSPLPVIPKAAARGTIPALSNSEMLAILDEEDAERLNRPAGH